MLSIFDSFRDITFGSMVLRMVLAMLCSGIVGLERSSKNRPAGLRTHILVCIAAATASMTGHFLYLNLHLPTDISRMGAQVISGLGFLGAGTIIVTSRQTIKGLTTAASLWATGIVGLAIGAGFYEGGIVTAVLILVVEHLFVNFGYEIRYLPEFSVSLSYDHRKALDAILRYCKDCGCAITDLQVTSESVKPMYHAIISLRPNRNIDRDKIVEHISTSMDVISVKAIDDEPHEEEEEADGT